MDENKEFIENENTDEDNKEAAAEETAVENNENAPEENGGDGEKNKDKSEILRDVFDIVESTMITIFVIVMIFTYCLHPVNIQGHSMVPTLNSHYDSSMQKETDKVFMNTVFFDVKYGDILVIDKDVNYLLDENGEVYVPDAFEAQSINECIIKRVIACGGQTIDIRDNQVIVDGKVLDEPYIKSGSTTVDLGAFEGQYPITIPEGYYFVMGDNRNGSSDSRAKCVGLDKKDQIYGKAIIKYSPLKEFDILIGSEKESKNDD